MLSGLRPGSLARLRFPLGELTKPEVRGIASHAKLEVAGRAESQDLCFLAGQGKREFLRRHAGLDERPGDVVDRQRAPPREDTTAITTSPSVSGEAWGWAAASRSTSLGTDAATNTVIAGPRTALSTRRVRIRGATPPPGPRRGSTASGSATTRRGGSAASSWMSDAGEATVALAHPVDGAAPGQVACLLDGDLVVGHGTIV